MYYLPQEMKLLLLIYSIVERCNKAAFSYTHGPAARYFNDAAPTIAFMHSFDICSLLLLPLCSREGTGTSVTDCAYFFYVAGAFFLYAGFAALGLVFIYGCLPETKGKKLEEIESLFENRLCTCGMSDSDEGRYIEYIRVKGSNYHLSDNDASDVE